MSVCVLLFLCSVVGSSRASAIAYEPLELVFAGDIMAHIGNQRMKNYDDIYAGVLPWLRNADFAFANLETPLQIDREISGYPTFNAKPEYAEAAVRAGFNVFSIANNHANDFGLASIEGTLKTMDELQKRYAVSFSGLKRKIDEPLHLEILNKKGWKIGFIALTNLLNASTEMDRVNFAGYWDPFEDKDFPKNEKALIDLVKGWRTQVDFLVLGLHDGIEYSRIPAPQQIRFYRALIEAGVDLLWAQHPHVLEPWAWAPSDRGERIILFSMGNFISQQTGYLSPEDSETNQAFTGDGALFKVTLGMIGGRIRVRGTAALLLNNYKDPEKGTIVRPTEDLINEALPGWRSYFKKRFEIQKSWLLPMRFGTLTS